MSRHGVTRTRRRRRPPNGNETTTTKRETIEMKKPNWKRDGMKSNGLYNKQPLSPLSDTPNLSESHKEAIQAYMTKYIAENNRRPSYTHMNKQFGIRATAKFYRGLII